MAQFLVGAVYCAEPKLQSGHIKLHAMIVQNLMDNLATPLGASFYDTQVNEALGGHQADEMFRIYYNDSANHSSTGTITGSSASYLVGFGGILNQAILDLANWGRPLTVMKDYLDRLAAAGLPREAQCLAALRPKMLKLASERTAGAHPYLVTPEHTAFARETMGPDALLAPEQGVVVSNDPVRARALARQALSQYRNRPNYTGSWSRLGFTDEDIAELSDRLVDGLFAWGDMTAIVDRVQAHQAAGADHVCLQVINDSLLSAGAARADWRALAAALL